MGGEQEAAPSLPRVTDDDDGRAGASPRPSLSDLEIAAARRDPRLDRDERGVVADFWDYLAEAERTRFLAVGGIEELRGALARERAVVDMAGVLGAERDARLEAAAERAAMADAESAAGHPGLNALVLVGMLGALDAMVESLVPSLRAELAWRRTRSAEPEVLAAADQGSVDAVKRALLAVATDLQRKPGNRPWGSGPNRWEKLLANVGLEAPDERPLPEGLVAALTEIAALRHVLVHRAGRVDAKALAECPTLPYRVGELVRLDRREYRRYSAAVRAYGGEVFRRLLVLTLPDEPPPPGDLAEWFNQYDVRS